MNWGELKAAVQGWVPRGDMASLLPTFLELAEQRIYYGDEAQEGLRMPSMVNDLANIDTFAPFDLGAGVIAVESITTTVSGRPTPLEYRTPTQIGIYEQDTGNPAFYTIKGSSLVVAPRNGASIQAVYYRKPPSPSADGDENDVMANFPSVYLYAMLMEVAVWMQDDGLLTRMGALFTTALRSAQKASRAEGIARTPMRIVADQVVRV